MPFFPWATCTSHSLSFISSGKKVKYMFGKHDIVDRLSFVLIVSVLLHQVARMIIYDLFTWYSGPMWTYNAFEARRLVDLFVYNTVVSSRVTVPATNLA